VQLPLSYLPVSGISLHVINDLDWRHNLRLRDGRGRKNSWKRLAFTLGELLIVVIIVGILAGLGVTYYRKVVVKAKAVKVKHAIALIAEAEKMYKIDRGYYLTVAAGAVEAKIGTAVTGINLAVVDNDTDFIYSVTGAGLISGSNTKVIGTCGVGSAITLNLPTDAWNIPACYK